MKNIFQLKPLLNEMNKGLKLLEEGLKEADAILEPYVQAKERLEFFRKITAEQGGFGINDLIDQKSASEYFKKSASRAGVEYGVTETITALLAICKKSIDGKILEDYSITLDRERFLASCEAEINPYGTSGELLAGCLDDAGLNFDKVFIPLSNFDAFARILTPERYTEYTSANVEQITASAMSETEYSNLFQEYCHEMRRNGKPIYIDDSDGGFATYVLRSKIEALEAKKRSDINSAILTLATELGRERVKMEDRIARDSSLNELIGVKPIETVRKIKSEEFGL